MDLQQLETSFANLDVFCFFLMEFKKNTAHRICEKITKKTQNPFNFLATLFCPFHFCPQKTHETCLCRKCCQAGLPGMRKSHNLWPC